MSSFGPIAYNLDINQLGASQYPRFSITQPSPYKDGLVEDVIVNELHPEYSENGSNIGMVKVRFIPDDRGVEESQLNWAYPLETSIREYPLRGELVLIFYSLGRFFYTRRINATNKLTESSWPGLSEAFSPKASTDNKSEAAVIASQGGDSYKPWGLKQRLTLGENFSENQTVRMVRPNEGDTLIEGRYGAVIRMGSSLFSNPATTTPQPNLFITVGQSVAKEMSTVARGTYALTYENINNDKNCIWITTNDRISFLASTALSENSKKSHLRSSKTPTTEYAGAQIFINSDRLVFNTKLNEISLFSKSEINLSSINSITLDSENSILMTANNMVSISSPKIFIGNAGTESEPMVLGNTLYDSLNDIVSTLSQIASALSAVPQAAAAAIPIKSQIESLKQKINAKNYLSNDNFVAKTNQIIVENKSQSQIISTQKLNADKEETPFTNRKNIRNSSNTSRNTVLGRYNTV